MTPGFKVHQGSEWNEVRQNIENALYLRTSSLLLDIKEQNLCVVIMSIESSTKTFPIPDIWIQILGWG